MTNAHPPKWMPAACLAAAVLSGCAGREIASQADMLPAAALLNGLKCELAAYAAENPKSPIIEKKWAVQGTLELKVDTENKAGGRVDVVVPFAPGMWSPLGAGVDVGGGETSTRKSSVEFVLRLSEVSRQECAPHPANPSRLTDGSVAVDGLGVSSWLDSFQDLTRPGSGFDPKKYTFCVTFGVQRRAELGGAASFIVVPVSLRGAALARREDVQILSIMIFEAPEAAAAGKGRVQTRSARPAPLEPRNDIRMILDEERRRLLLDT